MTNIEKINCKMENGQEKIRKLETVLENLKM